MRRLLALSAAFLLLAGAAVAQSSGAGLSLRGSQGAATSTAEASNSATPTAGSAARPATSTVTAARSETPPPPAFTVPPMSPIPPPGPVSSLTPSMVSADPVGQCRATCAKAYIFCLAPSEGTEDCPSDFAQCVAHCNRPSA